MGARGGREGARAVGEWGVTPIGPNEPALRRMGAQATHQQPAFIEVQGKEKGRG